MNAQSTGSETGEVSDKPKRDGDGFDLASILKLSLSRRMASARIEREGNSKKQRVMA